MDEIAGEYIKSACTLKSLAEKYGVPYKRIRKAAAQGNWKELRAGNKIPPGTDEKTDNDSLNVTSPDALAECADILSKLAYELCSEAYRKAHSDPGAAVTDAKAVKETCAVVKEVIAIKKSLEDSEENNSSELRVILEEPFDKYSQ